MASTLSRWSAGLAVGVVASVAAAESFSHIRSLAIANGYSPAMADMLPLSVDGLLVASSLALASATRPWLARTGLGLGIAGTIAANVTAGLSHGIEGAIVSAWPAISFLVASEIIVGMVRARPVRELDVPRVDLAVMHTRSPGTSPEATIPSVPEAVAVSIPGPADEDLEDLLEYAASAPAFLGTSRDATPAPGAVPEDTGTIRELQEIFGLAAVEPPSPRTVPGQERPKFPSREFRAEIARGEVPPIAAIKARMNCGYDKAKAIQGRIRGHIAANAAGIEFVPDDNETEA